MNRYYNSPLWGGLYKDSGLPSEIRKPISLHTFNVTKVNIKIPEYDFGNRETSKWCIMDDMVIQQVGKC